MSKRVELLFFSVCPPFTPSLYIFLESSIALNKKKIKDIIIILRLSQYNYINIFNCIYFSNLFNIREAGGSLTYTKKKICNSLLFDNVSDTFQRYCNSRLNIRMIKVVWHQRYFISYSDTSKKR